MDEKSNVREASSPDFCPPTEEGISITVEDDNGDALELEFLGLILKDGRSFAFFFPIDEDNEALSSGEVVLLEVVSTDEDGQPDGFELVEDESVAESAYEAFKDATSGMYSFE